MTIYLYVKTHRVTGLKYFGRTTRKNPYSYKGSGKYWRRHIKKHGNDVETEIIGTFENINDASDFALRFSEENNIVESQEWANLIPEDVVNVPLPMIGEKNYFFGKKFQGEEHYLFGKHLSEETKEKLRQKALGRRHSKETKLKMSEARKDKKMPEVCHGFGEKNPFFGKHHSEETKEKIRNTLALKWLILSPDGDEKIIVSLKHFCEENNLTKTRMLAVAHGKEKQHKGWKCKKLEEN